MYNNNQKNDPFAVKQTSLKEEKLLLTSQCSKQLQDFVFH